MSIGVTAYSAACSSVIARPAAQAVANAASPSATRTSAKLRFAVRTAGWRQKSAYTLANSVRRAKCFGRQLMTIQ